MTSQGKFCAKCGLNRPKADFNRCLRAPDGLNWWCQECSRAYQAAWKADHRERNRAYARKFYAENCVRPQLAKVCEFCGGEFSTARANQRFCGRECGRAWHRQHDLSRKANPWTERRRANYQKRRALKLTAMAERVLLADIRERDRQRCGLCGGRVGDEAYPHPLSASLDHVVPLSRGGEHVAANVQLAHLRCNVVKGVRGGGEQLRLVG